MERLDKEREFRRRNLCPILVFHVIRAGKTVWAEEGGIIHVQQRERNYHLKLNYTVNVWERGLQKLKSDIIIGSGGRWVVCQLVENTREAGDKGQEIRERCEQGRTFGGLTA